MSLEQCIIVKYSLLVLAAELFILSIFLFIRNRSVFSKVSLLIASSLLGVYEIMSFHLHEWDERYHALVAKDIWKNPLKPMLYKNPVLPYDYRNWAGNHVWLHKPPMTLWLIGASLELFGPYPWAVRVPSFIAYLLMVWLILLMARRLFGEKVAFISALLFSINPFLLGLVGGRYAGDHTDVIFSFFILLSFYFTLLSENRKPIGYTVLAGIALGMAILTKWWAAYTVVPAYFAYHYSKRKNFWSVTLHTALLGSIGIFIALPWIWFIHTHYPEEAAWESMHALRHLTEVIEGHKGPLYYYFLHAMQYVHPLVWIAVLWGLWKRGSDAWLLGIWILLPYLVFSLAMTKMPGFTVITYPALCMYISSFFFHMMEKIKTRRLKNLWLAAFILLFPIYNLASKMAKQICDCRIPEWEKKVRAYRYLPEGTVVLGEEHYIEAMFYSNNTVYPYKASPDIVEYIHSKGYKVLENSNRSLDRHLSPPESK